MKSRLLLLIYTITILLVSVGCRTFVVEDVNYSQQIESVLIPEEDGKVFDARHALEFNILPFQFQELKDSSSVLIDEVRLIRNAQGYYFITANKFNQVYVMSPEKSAMKLVKKISVSETGLISPAFNLRTPYVQLIELESDTVINLTIKGIAKEEIQS